MRYQQALDTLAALGPELRTGNALASGAAPRKFSLDHIRTLLAGLGDPQSRFPSVLIAGTNGKGSTAATLASITQAAGLRTGLYTSPHLLRVNERIQIDCQQIPDDVFGRIFGRIWTVAEQLVAQSRLPHTPSFFELLTATAFLHFAEQQVDLAVLEVGLGGRLDATNVVEPILSVITDIGIDHTEFLGHTITEIAREKAGILRPNGVLVTLSQHPEANAAIGERALELNVRGVDAARCLPPRGFTGLPPAPSSVSALQSPSQAISAQSAKPLAFNLNEIEGPAPVSHASPSTRDAIKAQDAAAERTTPGLAAASSPPSAPPGIAAASSPQFAPSGLAAASSPQSSLPGVAADSSPQSAPPGIAADSTPQSAPPDVAADSTPQSAPPDVAADSTPQSAPPGVAADVGQQSALPGVAAGFSLRFAPPVDEGASAPAPTPEPSPLGRNHYPLSIDGQILHVDSPLAGHHQQRNIALAVATALELRANHGFILPNPAIEAGIRETVWPGRLEWIPAAPNAAHPHAPLLLDVAHNPAGAWTLRAALAQLPDERPRTLIFSCLADKQIDEMARILLPLFDPTSGDPARRRDRILLAPINSPRAATVDQLLAIAHALDIPAHAAPHVAAALQQAQALTPPEGIIVATGSVYLIGELRSLALNNNQT